MKSSIITVPVHRGEGPSVQDYVAVEEPLQIRLAGRDIAVTMRTPGHDRELAAGFLFTEAILRNAGQIAAITTDDRGSVDVRLRDGVQIDTEAVARNFYVTSSCGVCGKASIDALRASGCRSLAEDSLDVEAHILSSLPEKLRESQAVFDYTGGLHAAGLFRATGELVELREDVGRHNAVDKLIGWAFLHDRLPLDQMILMLSGRISFELVQKAVMAGIPIIAAVGAPSSLAIETAQRFGTTLAGFIRERRFNLYSSPSRVRF